MGPQPKGGSFTGSTETLEFDGFLFDMDGTIVDSTPAVIKHWEEFGKEIGMDPQVILATSHGRRSIDTLREIDPSRANWEYISEIEGALPRKYGSSARVLPGSREAIDALTSLSSPWAIVTSGTTALMAGWLDVMRLPPPPVKVVAEDVEVGKPDPACYRLGRDRIGLGVGAEILVLEDAPAGVRAGKAAGCKVLGLATTHSVESVRDAGADWILRDLGSFKVLAKDNGRTKVEITDILVRE
ncbi:MAG: hypothetical protein MMC23_003941 [Stictis urceolatum]|nr:hypothetical protein [Stictis urceolata]